MFNSTVLKTERNVFVSMDSPLGEDQLIITKFEGYEALSEPFEFYLEMYAHDSGIDLGRLVGEKVTVTLKIKDKKRYFSGVVGEVAQGDSYTFLDQKSSDKEKTPTLYTAKIYPDFWKLKFNSGFQIYQDKATNDIIKTILEENSVNFKNESNTCGKDSRNYCVQYDESLFNFVSRLLEEEGIYYYFDFSSQNHQMIAGDSKGGYTNCEGIEKVSFVPTKAATPVYDVIFRASFSQKFTPKEVKLNDYNFEEPRAVLKVSDTKSSAKGGVVSHYPGGYKKYEKGEKVARIRLNTLEQSGQLMQGASSVSVFSAGHKFTLTGYTNASFDKEYVLKRVWHTIILNPEEDEYTYQNKFEAFTSDTDYHPAQVTPKPRIFGAQTAIVTGKKDEEIWVDKYGRVKVIFHWEPDGLEYEKSSCWIRVAQGWAGKNWGMVFTPRCNQEVVVTFLNGNPDNPLITGSVYNGDNMPPYLPERPTISTIKTNTSKGGGGFNELRFNDKKGSEEVFMHAQKDMNIEVTEAFSQIIKEGDEVYTVKSGNRTVLVQGEPVEKKEEEGDKGQLAGNSENQTSEDEIKQESSLEKQQKDDVKKALDEAKDQNQADDSAGKGGGQDSLGNDTLIIQRGSRFVYLKAEGEDTGNHSIEIARGNSAVHIKEGDDLLEIESGDHKIKIDKGNIDISLQDGNEEKKIKGKLTHNITKDYNLTIGGNLSINVDGQIDIKAGKGINMQAGKSINIKADDNIQGYAGGNCQIDIKKECNVNVDQQLAINTQSNASLEASGGIDIKAGSSFDLNAGNSISIKGDDSITLNAEGSMTAKANMDLSLSASTSLDLDGGMDASLKAGGSCNVEATGTLTLDGALVSIG